MATTVLMEDFESFADWTLFGTPNWGSGTTGKGVHCQGATQALTYIFPGGADSDVVTIGFSFRTGAIASRMIINLQSSDGTIHVQFAQNTSGVFFFLRGDGSSLASSAASLYVADTWYYLEIQVKMHDTTGFCILKINGVERINATGLDTKHTGTGTTIDRITIGSASTTSHYFDDLYIITGSDGAFLGPQRINGTGPFNVIHEPFNNLSAWTPVGTSIVSGGRNGTCALLAGGSGKLTLAIPSGQRSYFVVIGFAVMQTVAFQTIDFVVLNEVNTAKVTVRVSSGGGLSNSGLNAGGPSMALNTWHWLEAKFLCSNGTGTAWTIRLDGVDCSVGFSSSMASGTTGIDNIVINRLWNVVAGSTYIDDLYVLTGTLAEFEGDTSAPHEARVFQTDLRSLTTGVPIARLAQVSVAGLFPVNFNEAQFARIDLRTLNPIVAEPSTIARGVQSEVRRAAEGDYFRALEG